MDAARFGHRLRVLPPIPTRRDVARALAGLALGATLAPTWNDGAVAKKNKETCGPCERRKNGKCRGTKPDDAPCNGDGKCFAGTCVRRPTCLGFGQECDGPGNGPCCSGICIANLICLASNFDQPCHAHTDCSTVPTPLQCIAYRCRLVAA